MIDDDEMGARLKKNFEDFVIKQINEAQAKENADDDQEENKLDAHDFSVYRKLHRDNGKGYDQQFFSLLCKVFDEDMSKVEEHF